MKHINHILFALCCLLCSISCERERAQSGDLQIKDVGSNLKIYISGIAGEYSSFRIDAAHDWEIIEGGDYFCDPSSGYAGKDITINITGLHNNNSIDTLSLGDITFRLLKTRFMGATIHQLPRLRISNNSFLLSGAEGSCSELHITTDAGYTVKASEGAKFTLSDNSEGVVQIIASEEGTDSERYLGEIRLWLNEAPDAVTTIPVRQRAYEVVSQTIVCYMVGTSLGGYFNMNINQMLNYVGQNGLGDSRLLVLKTESANRATLYELRYDATHQEGVKEVIKSVSLPTPYNTTLFKTLLKDMTDIAPAEKYGVIIGSHGLGWIPKNYEPDFSSYEELHRLSIDKDFKLWTPVEGAFPTRHIGDSNVAVRFDTTEIAEAITASGKHIDYILFDACFMSSIEALYDLRKSCDYIMSSPCEIMAAGLPYSKILPYLLLEGGTSYDLDSVCRIYVDHYTASSSIKSACVALTKCDELEALASTLVAVNNAPIKEDFNLDNVQAYEGLNINQNPAHVFYDLEDMVEQSCSDEAAVEAFKRQLDKTILSRYHTEKFYSAYNGSYNDITHYSGVTTSARAKYYSTVWVQSEWYEDTH